MTSLVSLLLSFRPADIVQIWRVPVAKVLRAHLLGLSTATLILALTLGLHAEALAAVLGWQTVVVLFLLFAGGTWLGGLFVLLTFITFLVTTPASTLGATFVSAFVVLCRVYFAGYLGGAVLGILYNDIVFLYFVVLARKDLRIAFAYDARKAVNVIKSPKSSEEHALEVLVQGNPGLREQKLYAYELAEPPRFPYTIVLAGNPRILRRRDSAGNQLPAEPDPIISDLALFLQSVDRALGALEQDELLGQPEIWSRVRVVTLFNEQSTEVLAQEFQDELIIEGKVAENLLDTPLDLPHKIALELQQHSGTDGVPTLGACDIDVIFVLSAWPTHDRSTARYSDLLLDQETASCSKAGSKPFQFDPDPLAQKRDSNLALEINVTHCSDPGFFCEHDDFTSYPGRVALNVLGAQPKTFVHEFGHAMSSALRGAIVDEYCDLFVLKSAQDHTSNLPKAPFYVNRIERVPGTSGRFVPAHKIFARYNGVDFHSDLAHPSAEETWLGYFPERHDHIAGCTMDRTYGSYRFDRLISNFMHDRLTSKLNRPH